MNASVAPSPIAAVVNRFSGEIVKDPKVAKRHKTPP
jgi:hypothetical protein